MSEETKAMPKLEPMQAKLPSWLRPMTGIFSICAGLLYGLAICLVGAIYLGNVKKLALMSPSEKAEAVEKALKDDPNAVNVDATMQSGIEAAQNAVENLGPIFVIFLAFLGCLSMLTTVSGVGLLAKKPWSIGLGLMSSAAVVIVVMLFFLVHHSSFEMISQDLMKRDLVNAETGYGVMQSVRFAFLFSMCPAALFFANKLIIKQLKES